MWWPFGSGNKDTKELEKELPNELLQFFDKVNPESHNIEGTAKDLVVEKVLARQKTDYSYEFSNYKREELLKKVTAINCAEVQQVVVDCYQGWLFVSSNHCSDEIKRTTNCLDLQNKGLRQLRYESCYNKAQCEQMRTIVDILFTKNFGKLGENISEETERKFEQDVDRMFDKLWK